MKESLISVVLTLTTALLITSVLFHHSNNLVAAADSSWERNQSISPSSLINTYHQGANECSGLHCLIAVANHETDLFMDQLAASRQRITAMSSKTQFKPTVDCPALAYGGSDCTPDDVNPFYKNKKPRCDPKNRAYFPGCPQ